MEKREFKIDKAILWSIIQNQAGTLDKAFLELVMNAVDAGSTEVHIDLDASSFKVKDNGKGFVSRFEIENFFETFGTPHQEGDATFGRYRMGRGQIMSFSQNSWRSGEFQMEVDIKREGLNYSLKSGLPPENGCEISGQLYDPMKPSDHLRVCRDIETLCKYCPIPVFLNGRRVSLDMENEKWTFVDAHAYYLLRENSRTLDVYNLGVFVRSYPPSQFGTGGLVVSKTQLEVNFARNDVLVSKCETFKTISQNLRAYVKSKEGKKERKTGTYKDLLATRLMAGEVDDQAEFEKILSEEKLLVDVQGAQYSVHSLATAVKRFTGNLTLGPREGDIRADKVHQEALALVLSPKTAARFGVSTLSELLEQLKAAADIADAPRYSEARRDIATLQGALRDFQTMSCKISSDRKLVDRKSLTKEELFVFDAISEAQYAITAGFYRRGHDRHIREIRVGESESASGWTDGEMYIAINRELLKIPGASGGPMAQFDKLGTLLVHEYVHTSDDGGSHEHDTEFLQLYEGVSCCTGAVGNFVNRALGAWLANIRKETKRKLRRGEADEMDRQAELEKSVETTMKAAA